MKYGKGLVFLAVLLALLGAAGAALGEQARVITPGGPLNMRKKADEKSRLVESVPNRSMVEAEEIGEEWSLIVYKRQKGYVKTSFLKLPSQLPGQTVYPDGGAPLLRAAPEDGAPILTPLSCAEPVEILAVEGDWARVKTEDTEGWTEISHFTFQYQEAQGQQDWMAEPGVIAAACDLMDDPGKDGKKITALEPGTPVTVTLLEKNMCLALSEQGCGWADAACVTLAGTADEGGRTGSLVPMEAAAAAEKALTKQFKAFGKMSLYCAVQPEGGAYRCGFFTEQDQYVYGALVDAETGKALILRDYTAFAAPVKPSEYLPEGEMTVTLSAETLAVGEVLDISVAAWEGCQCRYALVMDGKAVAESEPGEHFSASFRPRETGEYTLAVTAEDKRGQKRTEVRAFTVDGSLPVQAGLAEVYSQKDGWWKDQKYRHSNLGKSGCAIFALSHALQRMGHTEDAALPEKLAAAYAYCLIPNEGTSNELLINTAAKDFGFTTRKTLYTDKKQIAGLLEQGAFFSFSIARGHIAMVCGLSEDGAMARVVDSAPGATFERIVGAAPYYQTRSGAFRAALSLDDLPGARWYFETGEYGGLSYWLPMDYVARRGVRLIQPMAEEET